MAESVNIVAAEHMSKQVCWLQVLENNGENKIITFFWYSSLDLQSWKVNQFVDLMLGFVKLAVRLPDERSLKNPDYGV